MITRDQLIAEAMEWIGTPHHHQASLKGVGCDCKGLVWGIARELDLPEARVAMAARADYSTVIDPDMLRAGLEAALRQTRQPQPGDVALMLIGAKAQHLGILMPGNQIIHTYQNGPGCVIKVPLGKSRRIDSYWTWPSLGD